MGETLLKLVAFTSAPASINAFADWTSFLEQHTLYKIDTRNVSISHSHCAHAIQYFGSHYERESVLRY